MSDTPTSTYDEIRWRVFPRVEICEEFFFCKSFWIDSLGDASLHSSDDLILTTIGNREDEGHLISILGSLYPLKEDCTH